MLNNIQEKFSEIIKYTVAIICGAIGILSVFFTVYFKIQIDDTFETCYAKFDNIIVTVINLIIGVTALYGFYKISDKINIKYILIIATVLSIIFGFAWVNYIKFEPDADQLMMVFCADNLLNQTGQILFEPGGYLDRYPHQLGYIIYVMIVFKFFRTQSNMLILQNLNVIYSATNGILIYLIAKELFEDEKTKKMTALLMGVFSILYWTFFDVHIYGNIPGLMFSLSAVLFTLKFLKNKKIYNLCIIAIALGIAYLLKSNYIIFLIGIVIVLIFDIIKGTNIKYALGIVGILAIMIGMKTTVFTVFEHNTGFSLDGGVPMLTYIYMGIAPGGVYSPGWYTGDVERIYNEGEYDVQKTLDIVKPVLLNRVQALIKHPCEAWLYFGAKLSTTWINPTFQVMWCSTPGKKLEQLPDYAKYIEARPAIENILCGNAYDIIERVFDCFQVVAFVSASFAIYKLKDNKDLKILLIPLIMLGGFAFHAIWETKSIYVIQYFYILIPFIAYGICEVFKYVDDNKIIEKVKEKILQK